MGSEDMDRQKLNVYRMKMLGAKVHPVESGSKTLKDAINEALRDWVTNVQGYVLSSGIGLWAHILTRLCSGLSERDREKRRESRSYKQTVSSRKLLFACVGGGSNSIGNLPFVFTRSGLSTFTESRQAAKVCRRAKTRHRWLPDAKGSFMA